jgi:DNA repair protein RecO (recombination protein O)
MRRAVLLFRYLPRSSLTIFLNEVIYKSIRQQGKDELLFEFLFYSIALLDRLEKGLANFHLYFLLRLTRFLGFFPDKSSFKETAFFDLKTAEFVPKLPPHAFVIEPLQSKFWQQLLESSYENLEQLSIGPADRKVLLDHLLDYYRLHVDNFGEIKSQAVLSELFS